MNDKEYQIDYEFSKRERKSEEVSRLAKRIMELCEADEFDEQTRSAPRAECKAIGSGVSSVPSIEKGSKILI
jgi:phage host-nuclease inhibitor protein Gam